MTNNIAEIEQGANEALSENRRNLSEAEFLKVAHILAHADAAL